MRRHAGISRTPAITHQPACRTATGACRLAPASATARETASAAVRGTGRPVPPVSRWAGQHAAARSSTQSSTRLRPGPAHKCCTHPAQCLCAESCAREHTITTHKRRSALHDAPDPGEARAAARLGGRGRGLARREHIRPRPISGRATSVEDATRPEGWPPPGAVLRTHVRAEQILRAALRRWTGRAALMPPLPPSGR